MTDALANQSTCIQFQYTGAWSGTDTPANCNKVEHDKILKHFGKLTQERKNFKNLLTSVEDTC